MSGITFERMCNRQIWSFLFPVCTHVDTWEFAFVRVRRLSPNGATKRNDWQSWRRGRSGIFSPICVLIYTHPALVNAAHAHTGAAEWHLSHVAQSHSAITYCLILAVRVIQLS